MNKEQLREIVFTRIGHASMCWSETIKGIFDTKQATIAGESIMKAIEEYTESPKVEGVEEGLTPAQTLAVNRIAELKAENERLRGLVEDAHYEGYYANHSCSQLEQWEQFKANNNL